MIKQAIIPLAGLGTRLLPLTSVFAKELLPINGKPGIQYILDECIVNKYVCCFFFTLLFDKSRAIIRFLYTFLHNIVKYNKS